MGMAQGTSHFLHLLLRPLFPFLVRDVGVSWAPPGRLVTTFFAVSGAGQALSGFVVRRAAPPGATGRVYGTVDSGLDLGFAMGAPLLGAFIDRDMPAWVFSGAALALMIGVASASLVGLRPTRVRPAAARA